MVAAGSRYANKLAVAQASGQASRPTQLHIQMAQRNATNSSSMKDGESPRRVFEIITKAQMRSRTAGNGTSTSAQTHTHKYDLVGHHDESFPPVMDEITQVVHVAMPASMRQTGLVSMNAMEISS